MIYKSPIRTAVILPLILSACMVGPDYQQPEIFSNSDIEQALDIKSDVIMPKINILHPFNDSILSHLIVLAKENNPTIQMALTKLVQARAYIAINQAKLAPGFDISATINEERESKNMNYTTNEDYYQLGVDMTWEVDIFGARRRQIESFTAKANESIASLENIYISLSAEIASAYISLRLNQQLLADATKNATLQKDLYTIAHEKYTSGLADSLEVKQAKYLYESTKALIPTYQEKITQANNQLSLLVGGLPKTLDKLLNIPHINIINIPYTYNIDNFTHFSADVIKNRPDVKMAENQLIAQNAQVGVAIANMYPSVSIGGFLGLESIKTHNLFNHNSYAHTLTPTITAPLFYFGQLKKNVDIQESIKQEKWLNYKNALLNASNDISNALIALEKEKIANQSYKKSYENIEKVAYYTGEKYKSGLIDYAIVLDAEQRKLSAQKALTTSNATLYQNIITFYKAIGG